MTPISTDRLPPPARIPNGAPDTNMVSIFSFPSRMFLSPGFETEQMPVRIVIIRVPRGKFGKMNVFKYFYSLPRVEEILRWEKGYQFNVLGLRHLRDPPGSSANELGIPGTLRVSTEQKQSRQESKSKSKIPPEPTGRSTFHRALDPHGTRCWLAYQPGKGRVSFPCFRGRNHLVHGPLGSSRAHAGSRP